MRLGLQLLMGHGIGSTAVLQIGGRFTQHLFKRQFCDISNVGGGLCSTEFRSRQFCNLYSDKEQPWIRR